MAPVFSSTQLTLRTVLIYGLILSLCALFVGYVLFQARFLIAGPEIHLYPTTPNPQENRVVTLEGTAENITHITLNGRQIYTNASGYFKEELILENGYTIATLQAEDRYGRVQKLSADFVYNPKKTRIISNNYLIHGIQKES